MYYGEENECANIEEKAMDAFANILKQSKIERRVKNLTNLVEICVEHNIGHPRIIQAIENQTISNPFMDRIDDLIELTTVGR